MLLLLLINTSRPRLSKRGFTFKLSFTGPKRFCGHIQAMIVKKPLPLIPWSPMKWYFMVCWLVISPICMTVSLLQIYSNHYAYRYRVYWYILPEASLGRENSRTKDNCREVLNIHVRDLKRQAYTRA